MRTDRPRPRSRALAAPALLAVLALTVAGCGGSDDAEPSPSEAVITSEAPETGTEDTGTEDASPTATESGSPTATQSASPTDSALPTTTASPTASATADAGGAVDVDEEALDRLEVVLLTPQTAPDGVFTDVEVQRLPLETLETSLTLTGVNPTGECADLIERINTQVVPGAGAVLAEYTVDAQHATGFRTNPPEVFTMLAASQDDEDISEIVGHLPEVCGSFGGDQTGWVEMTPIPGVEGAARVAMSMVEGGDVMIDMVLGGESDGTEHVYMGMINVDPDAAAEVMLAQVEAFRDRER